MIRTETLAANYKMTYTFVHWQHDNLQFASNRSNISHYRFLDWFIESGYMNKKRKRRLEVTSYTIRFFVWNWKSPRSKTKITYTGVQKTPLPVAWQLIELKRD